MASIGESILSLRSVTKRHWGMVALSAALSVAISPTKALTSHDHLIPEDSGYAWGSRGPIFGAPNPVFDPLFDRGVVVRMIAEPSFVGAHGVGIAEDQGRFHIIVISAPFARGKEQRCEKDVERELAKRAISTWRSVLMRTHFSDDLISGADGEFVHFSMFERFEYSSPERPGRRLHYAQMLAGRVWSPLAGTPPALLLELADSFVDLCHSRTPFEQQSAIQQAARTLDKLAAERAGGR